MLADTQADAERLAAHILALKAYDLDVKLMVIRAINRPPFQRSVEGVKLYEATKLLADSLHLPLGETTRGGFSDGNLWLASGGRFSTGSDARSRRPRRHEHILASTVAPRAALMFGLATDPVFHSKF